MDHFILRLECRQPIQEHLVHFLQILASALAEFGCFSRFDELIQQVGSAQLVSDVGTKSGFFQSGHKDIEMFQHVIVPISHIDTRKIPQRSHRKLRGLVTLEE